MIVADNPLFSDALMAQLQQGPGFDVHTSSAADIDFAMTDFASGFDLILLSVKNPAGVQKSLREKLFRGPILELASKSDQPHDPDSMVLPVRYPVLAQKIRSLTISYWFRDDTVIDIGPMQLRPAFKELSHPDAPPIPLTEREVEILIYLYRAGGKIISRDILLAEIWGYNAGVSTHTLETHIYRLRQKIEINPEVSGLLITEAGGYRLLADRE